MLKKGINRNQLQMLSLESLVAQDSVVRVIDAFVDALPLEQLGFIIKGKIKNGAPAYPAKDLLKLYYYGYLNKVRSSRKLEREAITNLEAMWLIKGLRPGYKTIADFRKDNKKGFKNVFRSFNQFLLRNDLFDAKLIAVDGSKFRAQNSKKNNYNEKKVEQHLEYIEKQTQQYLERMDELDEIEEETESQLEQRIDIAQKLDHLNIRQQKYEDLEQQVKDARLNEQTQISTVDPDARALPKKMNIVEVGYNLVTATEAKNKFITNFKVFNQNDAYTLSDVAKDAKAVLNNNSEEDNSITVLADKGFDTGHELKICAENNIQTIVAPKKRQTRKKNPKFAKDAFEYDVQQDTYICPQGEHLTTNGNDYQKKAYGQHRASYKFKRYKCSYKICKQCPFKDDCVGKPNLKQRRGRVIERSEYDEYIEDNIQRYLVNKELYRQRQAIVEHPFGTIKRQWGYDHTLLKTTEKVTSEFSIILTCYNLRRAISILGVNVLVENIKTYILFVITLLQRILSHFELSLKIMFFRNLIFPQQYLSVNQFYRTPAE